MNIVFFASSVITASWNGATSYFRGIVRALADRGHQVTFLDPDGFDPRPRPRRAGVEQAVEHGRDADLVIKTGGAGAHDDRLEQLVLELQGPRTLVAFWDVDPVATLARVEHDPDDPFRALIARYDLVFTYGGDPALTDAYLQLGAPFCVPIHNALDPATHHRVAPDPRFAAALGFLGNRLPDRERRVDSFLFGAARRLPDHRVVLGGAGWHDQSLPANIAHLGHVFTRDHNAFHATPRAVLHLSRGAVAAHAGSPPARVLEAAGAGACLISDPGSGLDQLFEPGREVLIAHGGEDVAHHVASLDDARARAIGDRAQARALHEHTYAHRARAIETALGELPRAHATRWAASRVHRPAMTIVVIAPSLTSAADNPHAATYRGLVRALAERGHDVTFLEADPPGMAPRRDLVDAGGVRIALYAQPGDLYQQFTRAVRDADLVVVGSGVRDGVAIGAWVIETAHGLTAFYDLDTPVTLAALEAGTCGYLSRALVPRYAMYLSGTGGPTLARIEQALGSPRALPLYEAVDPVAFGPAPQPTRWALGFVGEHHPDRQPALQRLLIEPARRDAACRFAIAGAGYPASLEWAPNIEWVVEPGHPRAFYNALAFHLSVTRPAMQATGWSPRLPLFEAAACAVPSISDAWDGLDELFEPNQEILIAHDGDDVLRFLRDVRDSERRAIGARACTRIHASHTAAHRAAELERYVRT